ncbi:MAG: ATP-binding protein [Lachnospiraceae bacterium]|jgi:DNA replication protein|nr:ATP-binding protein [Lachnospiraceae bacterium]
MSLTNRQYDTIMRGYDHRQYRNYRIQCARREEIYKKLPRIQKVEEEISSCSLSHTEQILSLQETDPDNAHPEILTGLRRKLDALRQEKETLLGDAGYPADYLDMPYTCPDCQDTGYIGSRKCHCFLQEEIRLLYSSSRLEHVLSEENFSTLSYDVYDEEQQVLMPSVIHMCRSFVDTFGDGQQNLYFYGPVGTGKTFLSNCIAKALLDRHRSVIYFTAFQFFELFSLSDRKSSSEDAFAHEALLESDLLILDDIGTELANTFTVSKLFQVLNERALRKRSTILSTNLPLMDFRDIYSERIFSRITSSYTLVKFCGSDIRIRKKLSRSS